MRIVNLEKFIKSILLILAILFLISFMLTSKTFSHGEAQYTKLKVSDGDTLWSIAEVEQKENPYFENKDIRDIICSIKKVNNLKGSNLIIGQELLIPIN